MGFSRQEHWSGWPFPPSGHLPDPGIEPVSLVSPALASGFFITVPPGKLVHRREAQGEAGHPQRHPDAGPPGLRGNMLV